MDDMLVLNTSAAGVGLHSFCIPMTNVEVYYVVLKLLPAPRERAEGVMTTDFREAHTHLRLRMTMWMKGNVVCWSSHEGE